MQVTNNCPCDSYGWLVWFPAFTRYPPSHLHGFFLGGCLAKTSPLGGNDHFPVRCHGGREGHSMESPGACCWAPLRARSGLEATRPAFGFSPTAAKKWSSSLRARWAGGVTPKQVNLPTNMELHRPPVVLLRGVVHFHVGWREGISFSGKKMKIQEPQKGSCKQKLRVEPGKCQHYAASSVNFSRDTQFFHQMM